MSKIEKFAPYFAGGMTTPEAMRHTANGKAPTLTRLHPTIFRCDFSPNKAKSRLRYPG
jgi:hypothetical protein